MRSVSKGLGIILISMLMAPAVAAPLVPADHDAYAATASEKGMIRAQPAAPDAVPLLEAEPGSAHGGAMLFAAGLLTIGLASQRRRRSGRIMQAV